MDVGQAQDFTAMAIIDCDETAPRGETVYRVIWLARWPLMTPYHVMVQDIVDTLAKAPPRSLTMMLDATGCGRPVYEQFVVLLIDRVIVNDTQVNIY